MEYKVHFEVFEGPLDLLLYLVKKEEVDIYQINLTRIATQFIEYVELMRQLDLDIAGEFLVMSSTLMYIKSRELLPLDQQVQPEEADDDLQDPRWELIRQLVEYKKFKDAALQLQDKAAERDNIFPRQGPAPEFPAPPVKPAVSLFDLINAVNAVLKRVQSRADLRDIFEDKWSVSEKIEFLMDFLRARTVCKFSELFAAAISRSEVVVTFLAMLELIRLKQITVRQHDPFSEIEITRLATASPIPPPAEAAAPAAALEKNPSHGVEIHS